MIYISIFPRKKSQPLRHLFVSSFFNLQSNRFLKFVHLRSPKPFVHHILPIIPSSQRTWSLSSHCVGPVHPGVVAWPAQLHAPGLAGDPWSPRRGHATRHVELQRASDSSWPPGKPSGAKLFIAKLTEIAMVEDTTLKPGAKIGFRCVWEKKRFVSLHNQQPPTEEAVQKISRAQAHVSASYLGFQLLKTRPILHPPESSHP